MTSKRTLLILPCTDQKPYSKSRTWSYVQQKLAPWREYIDIAAIDCIANPADGKPFGLVMEWEEWKTQGLDERPSRDKITPLQRRVQERLDEINGKYCQIVAYINVKSYWEVLWKLRRRYHIRMLPRVFHNGENWKSSIAGVSPRGAFYKYVRELTITLSHRYS